MERQSCEQVSFFTLFFLQLQLCKVIKPQNRRNLRVIIIGQYCDTQKREKIDGKKGSLNCSCASKTEGKSERSLCFFGKPKLQDSILKCVK